MEEIVVGIDVGTTKVCTLVGRVEDDKSIRILGVGIEPSEGIRKGIVVDLEAASRAIHRALRSPPLLSAWLERMYPLSTVAAQRASPAAS